MDSITRRGFVSAASLGVAAMGMGGAAAMAEDAGTWDYECDILVIGHGGAGAAAAITAVDEGLGEVLVVEAAPQEYEGGNTRVSGQSVWTMQTVEDAVEYQRLLNGRYEIPEDVLLAWAEGICENIAWLEYLGADMISNGSKAEFASIDYNGSSDNLVVDGVVGNMRLWEFLMEVKDDLGYEVLYDTRARHLVRDADGAVIGVEAERADGSTIRAHGRKGTILACGGFENNPEMLRSYMPVGISEVGIWGTPYNVGDGIKMAIEVGADLWNMNNTSGLSKGCKFAGADKPFVDCPQLYNKAWIMVGPDSKRFCYEEALGKCRHGKLVQNGVYRDMSMPLPAQIIFGKECFEAGSVYTAGGSIGFLTLFDLGLGATNEELVEAGVIVKADTVEELAEKVGLDPEVLAKTVSHYNESVAAGFDDEFGRGGEVLAGYDGLRNKEAQEKVQIEAFELEAINGPYYALQVWPLLINTQGGPRRNASCEILDPFGNPIPGLFGAGELGCEYSYLYNGGGNVAEALSSGRAAARAVGQRAAL